MKKCTKCGEEKDELSFWVIRKNGNKLRPVCKNCSNESVYAYYHKNKEKRKRKISEYEKRRRKIPEVKMRMKFNNIMCTHGISKEKYFEILLNQNYSCFICKRQFNKSTICDNEYIGVCIDHCHKTGKVRGFLCHNCNTMLGHARDSVEILNNAANYILNSI